ncbi:MAG: hypothetical protein HY039_05175, partial [Nitrospirae bacterium]|nr:hypothetical protein [Nitrospirota bacterium]
MLFYDHGERQDPHVQRETVRRRETERTRQEADRIARGALIDSRREAEALIASAKDIDISQWPDEKLDRAMDVI